MISLEPIIISAPFGNYLHFNGCSSTFGTFTWHRRGGFPWRLWRIVRTLRYSWKLQSWRNKLGLPNSGILSVDISDTRLSGALVSILGFNKEEWANLLAFVHQKLPQIAGIELNLSCPNIDHRVIVADVIPSVNQCPKRIIAKLPPLKWMDIALPLYESGVRTFHCCNTLWTPAGGFSGEVLKPYSLWAVESMRKQFGSSVTIIGGGGVRERSDVVRYVQAGADRVAVGSMLLNPLQWSKVSELRHTMVQPTNI